MWSIFIHVRYRVSIGGLEMIIKIHLQDLVFLLLFWAGNRICSYIRWRWLPIYIHIWLYIEMEITSRVTHQIWNLHTWISKNWRNHPQNKKNETLFYILADSHPLLITRVCVQPQQLDTALPYRAYRIPRCLLELAASHFWILKLTYFTQLNQKNEKDKVSLVL